MPSFSDLRNSFKLQRQAKKVQKDLKNIHVEAEAPGVHVTVSAALEVIAIEVSPDVTNDRIGPLLVDTLNRAMKKAQVISAEKMQAIMGDMGLSVGS